MPFQPRAQLHAKSRDPRLDSPSPERSATPARVVGLVRAQLGRPPPRASWPTVPNWRDCVDRRFRLPVVVHVRARHGQRRRRPGPVHQQMDLRAALATDRRTRSASLPTFWGGNADQVKRRPQPIEQLSGVQLFQNGTVQSRPDTCGLPLLELAPARQATSEPELSGQGTPRKAVAQDKQDAAEHRAVVETRTTTLGPRRDRKKWSCETPQLVWKQLLSCRRELDRQVSDNVCRAALMSKRDKRPRGPERRGTLSPCRVT